MIELLYLLFSLALPRHSLAGAGRCCRILIASATRLLYFLSMI
nr:MAG TPA: hypothetical protein [Caudoviricetes sp.]